MISTELLLGGIQAMLQPMPLLWLTFGSIAGTLIGALPGLGPSSGVAILMPLSFALPPASGLGMLVSVYLGCMYGGRISSILINTPGDAAAIMTCMDGYPLMRKGRGGVAMGISALTSFFGGAVGIIFMTFFTPAMARVALSFAPPEQFAVMVFSLIAINLATDNTSAKGLVMVMLGLALGTVGAEYISGRARLTFGITYMLEGIPFIAVAVGLFGLGGVFVGVEEKVKTSAIEFKMKIRDLYPSWAEIKSVSKVTLLSTVLGLFVGVLPGAGSSIATFVAYGAAKKVSKHPEEFGHGSLEGVAAPEAANNACVPGALAPMMALGIPGSNVAAMLMVAFMVHDLVPGPLLFVKSPDVAWAIIGALYVCNFILLFTNTAMIPMFVWLIRISERVLHPCVAFLCVIGVYSFSRNMFGVIVLIVFGVLGYFLKKGKYPQAGLLLALILGKRIEENFRLSLIMGRGNYFIFFNRPIALGFMIATLLCLLAPFVNKWRIKAKKAS